MATVEEVKITCVESVISIWEIVQEELFLPFSDVQSEDPLFMPHAPPHAPPLPCSLEMPDVYIVSTVVLSGPFHIFILYAMLK